MRNELQINGCYYKSLIVLTISYGPELLFQLGAADRLMDELVTVYKKFAKGHQAKSCVVYMKVDTAGSSIARALFKLFRIVVDDEGGQLFVVGYPIEYIDSLTMLGFTSLSGFSLSKSLDSAASRIAPIE